jgi:hypothetical protein
MLMLRLMIILFPSLAASWMANLEGSSIVSQTYMRLGITSLKRKIIQSTRFMVKGRLLFISCSSPLQPEGRRIT